MPALDLDHRPTKDPARSRTDGAIGGAYRVEASRPAGTLGGLPAFAATDLTGRRTGLLAVLGLPHLPPRPLPLSMLAHAPVEGMICPIAHGPAPGPDGTPGLFTIYAAPAGPPAAPGPAWSEADLLTRVLRPAAAALDRLAAVGLTHRAIRPENLYPGRQGTAMLLGPGWSAPPGCLQTALYEPPYLAMCHPAGRGEGRIADDVYALGASMVVLALGRDPLAGLGEAEIVRRKLERGSFAALLGDARLPGVIADLAGGMMAEDPDHRPTPAMLADPGAARGRRVAARPPRRAQRSLELGGQPVWTARNLAHALTLPPAAGAPEERVRLLRDGSIDRWLRRSLGDPALAVRLEEAMRRRGADIDDAQRADHLLLLRCVALLDPLAPVSWRGVTFFPDGIGPLLAATAGDGAAPQAALRDAVESEAQMAWAAMRADRQDPAQARQDSHRQLMWLRQRGWAGGLPRLRYALNPLLPCDSPVLGGRLVTRLEELLPALDQVAAQGGATGPIDAQIGAFLAARQDQRIDSELSAIAEARDPAAAALVQLRLLGRLQQRLRQAPAPALAAWLGARAAPVLAGLQNQASRAAATARLEALKLAGDLAALHALIEDPGGWQADAEGAALARQRLRQIDAELATLAAQVKARGVVARRWAQEFATCLGYVLLAALAVAAVVA